MAICGHQFHGGDESDWVLSTSACCLDGSATANKILQELFKRRSGKMTTSSSHVKRQRTAVAVPENPHKAVDPEERETLMVRGLTGGGNFEDFDESQHLNGCPVKWLYQKKLLDRGKKLKVGRLCYKKTVEGEGPKEKHPSVRDKTPVEVKIHKINLMAKYTSGWDESYAASCKPCLGDKSEGSPPELEGHRKKLAAKLNWKLHDDSQEELGMETSSEISSRHNYLPPRPLMGLNPLLTVLLAPRQETACCSLEPHVQNPTRERPAASLSIRCLDFPDFSAEAKPRPRTTNTPRWGAKSSRLVKKLQIPPRVTLDLGQNQSPTPLKSSPSRCKLGCSNPPGRKLSERGKQTKSLSSLFYELKDKTGPRNDGLDYFEEMIGELTMDEGEFKMRRFLNVASARFDTPRARNAASEATKEKSAEAPSAGGRDLNLVCGKVRFSQKPLSPGKPAPEERRRRRRPSS